MFVPPTPVTHGEDAGKLTACWGLGRPWRSKQDDEPSSPLEASTEMPLAAASCSADSTVVMFLPPIACLASASQLPSDAEITSGLRPGFVSGTVSACSTSDASGCDS